MLVATTVPHYLAIIPLLSKRRFDYRYMKLIFLATTLSVAYHVTKESNPLVTALDYLAAAALAYHEITIHTHALPLNALLCMTNQMVPQENYIFYHSLWHLASVAKTIYIASDSQIQTLSKDEVSEDERPTVL